MLGALAFISPTQDQCRHEIGRYKGSRSIRHCSGRWHNSSAANRMIVRTGIGDQFGIIGPDQHHMARFSPARDAVGWINQIC